MFKLLSFLALIFVATVAVSGAPSNSKRFLFGQCSFIANCFVDPCMYPSSQGCASYPQAVCVSNYCNGCNYNWWYNGAIVQC